MINLKEITEIVQNGLNSMSDQAFVIYPDLAEFKKAYRQEGNNTITHYVNGIMEALAPTRLPIKNLEVVTQSYRITFALDIALLTKTETGTFREVENIRNILETYISANNGNPYYLNDNDKVTFEITPTFSGVTVGTATQLSPIGDTLPMYLDFSCIFVESGINTNNVDFIINGENIFYQSYSITRSRTSETNMIASEKSSKTLAQANGLSIQLTKPLLNTPQSLDVEEDIYNGTQNRAICVERRRGDKTYAYIMIYGNNTENGEISKNIGHTVNLVEGKQNELTYNEYWVLEKVTAENEEFLFVPINIDLPNAKSIVIFWGDGQYEHIDTNNGEIFNTSHTYKKNGDYIVRIFCYNLPFIASNLNYILSSDNYYSIDISPNIGTELKIPEYHLGLPVKEINKYAFSEQPFIEKIIYQNIDNIISIGNEAFKDTNIRILNIGKNVSNIGYGICTNCKNLEQISVDENNMYFSDYGKNMVCVKSDDKNLTIYQGCKTSDLNEIGGIVKQSAFKGIELDNPNLRFNSISFERDAFRNSSIGLLRIDGSAGFAQHAFSDCEYLGQIDISRGSIYQLNNEVFSNCSSLSVINLPSQISELPDNVFLNCPNLTTCNYAGTKTQWNNIEVKGLWYKGTGLTKVHCKDGDIDLPPLGE